MSRLLLTNCPNCAAPLESDGTCKYCNTKARYANEIDFEGRSLHGTHVEILLKEKRPNGEIVLYPFQGYLREMSLNLSNDRYFELGMGEYRRITYGPPGVELTFEGVLVEPRDAIHINKNW